MLDKEYVETIRRMDGLEISGINIAKGRINTSLYLLIYIMEVKQQHIAEPDKIKIHLLFFQ